MLATLWPFDFTFTATFAPVKPDCFLLSLGKSSVLDVFENIALFVPFGLGLAGHLRQSRLLQARKAVGAVIICSLTLSYVIEVLQIFQPTRFPAIIDVVSNSIGGLVGYGCYVWLVAEAGE
jgi:glycopeptide antibiotics resistance protein